MIPNQTIETLDLTPVIQKLRDTVAEDWQPERLQAAEAEYRRMLAIKAAYPDVDLVPTADVDEVWHAHILHTRKYAADMHAIFGNFLHHEPNDGSPSMQPAMDAALANTQQLYMQHFGNVPTELARCRGKPCHAPTSCRCR